MDIMNSFSGRLGGSVGNNMDNNKDDVLKTKRHLSQAGYMTREAQEMESPFITRKMDEGIKAFQRDRVLKIDGILKPGGETERSLFEILTNRSADEVFGSPSQGNDSGSIGFGGNVSGTLGSITPPFSPEAIRGNTYINSTLPSDEPTTPARHDATGRLIRDPNNYNEMEFLDKIEKTFKNYVQLGRDKGLDDAASNLDHFLTGSGTDKILSREEARDKIFIRNGEETNRKRFSNSFINKKKIGSKFLNLKDGETIDVKDYWDYEVGYLPKKSIVDPSRSHILRGDLDETLSTGSSSIKSNGEFKAKRQGNTIFIDGIVNHKWQDIYDFHPMQSGGASAVSLVKAGRAKNFDITSKWKQRVTGTLQIKNGNLIQPRLIWEDINP